MQSIFKKTLLAAAIAGVASVNAADITGNGGVDSTFTNNEWPLVSAEGLAIAGEISIGTMATDISVDIEIEANYQETDLLIVTISGATISDASAADLDGGLGNFELLGSDPENGTITFRPVQGSGGVAPGTGALTGVVLEDLETVVSVASRGVTVQGFDIDAGASTPVAQVGSEYGFGAGDTLLDATIDVEQQRKQFVGGTTDNFTLDVTGGADLLATDTNTYVVTVSATDLGFLRDGDGELDATSYELDGETEAEAVLNDADNALTITSSTADVGANTVGVTFTADGVADADAQQLEAQDYIAGITVNYDLGGTNGSVDFPAVAVGSWGLSGAQVNIPFMPFGGGISQFIYISNDGNVSGDIEVIGFDDAGNSFGPVLVNAQARAGTNNKLAPAIITALAEAGANISTGRLDITLTINSPKDDIEVFAGYNSRGDRVVVDTIKLD